MKILHAVMPPLIVPLLVLSASCASDRGEYLRVNQVGYESGSPMRAYLMAAASQSGATFIVRNSHRETSYSGTVG
jgi:hypothetical protein